MSAHNKLSQGHHGDEGYVGPSLSSQPVHFGFIVLDSDCLLPLASALEVLKLANCELEQPCFNSILIGDQCEMLRWLAGIGGEVFDLDAVRQLDYCFVLASTPVTSRLSDTAVVLLRRLQRCGTALGAIDAGIFALAAAGFVATKRCSVDHRYMACFSELFPDIVAVPSLFEVDGRCATAAGGIGAAEMIVWLISQWLDRRRPQSIVRRLQLSCLRSPGCEQSLLPTGQSMVRSSSVREAMKLLSDRHDVDVSPGDVARHLGITVRQLERLFKRHLGVSPARYRREQKLQKAKQLLTYTDLPIAEVALSSGFSSVSNFRRLYKRRESI